MSHTLQSFNGLTGEYAIYSSYDGALIYSGRTTPDENGMEHVSELAAAIRKAEAIAFKYAKGVIFERVNKAIREVQP